MRAFLIALLLAAPAAGQSRYFTSAFTFQPNAPWPIAQTWKLCTAGDECVTASLSADGVTELDQAAWFAASRDPAYNRSIMTFGDQTKEKPFLNPYVPHFGADRVDLLQDWFGNSVTVTGGLADVRENIPGDFDYNGIVDSRDYLRWRRGSEWLYNATRSDGKAVPVDYDIWRANFGRNEWDGLPWSGVGLSAAAIPEPSTIMLCLMVFGLHRCHSWGRSTARR